jgi:putative ABC transport system permease protein
VRSVMNAASVDLGFDPDRVFTVALEPRLAGLNETRTRQFHDDLQRKLASLPGVASTALALFVPLGDRGDELNIRPSDRPDARARSTAYNIATPGYLEMLNVPLLRGRTFTAADAAGAPRVVIVNEPFAAAMWPGKDPLAQVIRVADEPGPRQVIGVVGDSRFRHYSDAREPLVYFPYRQFYRADMVFHVKLASPDAATLRAVRAAIVEMNPDVPAAALEPMTIGMAWALVPVRVAAVVLGTAGSLALALALIGLYALLSHGVAQRTREIGIRVALGATAHDIRRLIARDVSRLALASLAAGTVLAVAVANLMRALLVGIAPADPVAIAGALGLLVAVIWIAMRFPTRRALRIEPSVALRDH